MRPGGVNGEEIFFCSLIFKEYSEDMGGDNISIKKDPPLGIQNLLF